MIPFSAEKMLELKRAVEKALASGAAPIAAFDADGTLWDTDIGEHFFDYQIRKKLLPNLPEQAWAHYRKMHSKNPPEAFLWLAQINKGHDIREVRKWAHAAFLDYGKIPVFKHIQEIIKYLLTLKVQTYIVTASIQWAVEPGAEMFGIPTENVIGVKTKIDHNQITDAQDGPITWHEGKVTGLMLHTNNVKPFFTAGNTMGDLALLECSSHLRFVNSAAPKGHTNYETEKKLADLAISRGWYCHNV